MPHVGQVVRALRQERGISQSQLAQKAGLEQSYLSRLETQSRQRVDVGALVRIAEALGVSLREILVQAEIERPAKSDQVLRWLKLRRLFNSLSQDRQRVLIDIARALLTASSSKPSALDEPAAQLPADREKPPKLSSRKESTTNDDERRSRE